MTRSLCAESGNDCDAQLHEFGCQGRKPVVLALCPAIFDLHILTVYKACFFQTLPKCIHEESGVGRSNRAQKSNDRYCALLGQRRQRPRCRCTAKNTEKISTFHLSPLGAGGDIVTLERVSW